MKTKNLTVMLMCTVLAAGLAACGDSQTETTASGTQVVSADAVTESEAVTENPYDPHLPDYDCNGETFTFAVRGTDGDTKSAWNNTDIVAESLDGEVLNDAIYERTRYIEETYNTKIAVLWCGDTGAALTGSDMSQMVTSSIMSGDHSFDAILSSPYDSAGYAINGYSVDLTTIPNLNLSNPWWDQNAIEELSFGGKIYFTTGELTIIDNKATQCMLFNKEVAAQYDIASPYDAVKEGTWTLERFQNDCKTVYSDLNGDGVMNEDDMFGYIYWQDGCFGLIHSCGNTFGTIDEGTGMPELSFYTERMVETWSSLIDMIKQPYCFSIKNDVDLLGKDAGPDDVIEYMMSGNHTLYSFAYVNHVLNLRDIETDFGILPNPKYDVSQEQYYATAHGYGTCFLSVPTTMTDPERTGIILEAFCAKSAEIVTPAFYDITLTTKSVRDEDSAEMLDLIFASKRYDIGYYFMWGDLTNKVMNAWNSKNENLASLYEKAEQKAEKAVARTIESLTAIN